MRILALALCLGLCGIASTGEARKRGHHAKKKKRHARKKHAAIENDVMKRQRAAADRDRDADKRGEAQLAELRTAKEIHVKQDPIPGLQERDDEVPGSRQAAVQPSVAQGRDNEIPGARR